MTMSANEKRMLEREALRSVIQQWNANRLDLFELSEPDESLQFHGVMRFYFQDHGQKVATKCIRVASDATVQDVIETLIEKFRPDMRMLSLPSYALYEVHSNGEERQLNTDEKPLLVQLNWHIDDREGRFLLRDTSQKTSLLDGGNDLTFKRKLSKREKKEQKKKDKLAKLNSTSAADTENNHVAEKLYTELPETSFTRSISNPEAVMRRRRQQILEKKLQQFRSRDGGPDTGGTLKIYGESLCRDVPYKTLLLSIRDCAQAVVREMLAKYGLDKTDPLHYCLVQVNSDGTEYILDDDECPLSILMNHPTSRGSIMFHVRRRPADSQPRRRKKKPLGVSNGGNSVSLDREGPTLVEITHSGDGGRRVKLSAEPIEVGSANTNQLQLFGPSIQPRHCLISLQESVCTVTPLHADALTFVNGHHIQQPTILHNGSVVMFGRVASYRFVDTPSEGRYNLALSQSQLDAACLYESRSPTSPSWTEETLGSGPHPAQSAAPVSAGHANASMTPSMMQKSLGAAPHSSSYLDASDTRSMSGEPPGAEPQTMAATVTAASAATVPGVGGHVVGSGGKLGYNNNQYVSGAHASVLSAEIQLGHIDDPTSGGKAAQQQQLDNKSELSDHDGGGGGGGGGTETTETKSMTSIKSGGSNADARSSKMHLNEIGGQEPILPAVLEFPETHQEIFLAQVISELDVNQPNFKLAPVYTLYLCARYRASTHYRPELQPTERAHKLTAFLHHVANLIFNIVQEQYQDPKMLSFWMANASEFLHFLKSDRHISAFSVQAQEVLAESVQMAFRNLVNCFRVELSQTLNQFLSENIDHESAAGLVLTVLGSAMGLLRRCRVNAALTIQLFSQLFHYINCVCFNTIVTNPHLCIELWGQVLTERLRILEVWALRQGLELAADCHLAKINQCAKFLMAPKTTDAEVKQLARSCFRLNSLQMAALLSQDNIAPALLDTAIGMAESVADELTRSDGRDVCLEESPDLPLALLIPDDGFSCEVVRGIPAGLVDFVSQLQTAGMCRLAAQPTSIGLWTVYMHQYNVRSSSAMSSKVPQPEVQVIKLHKNSNGMGLSIVAAKGAGQERLGIYIKSVVPGGAADADGRLQAGDQLLKVDGQSLIGITQERAADYLVRTGPVVSLEVAKQGAIFHGLATLLQQPSPVITRGTRRMSERDVSRLGVDGKPPLPMHGQPQLPNSKSVPALHHVGAGGAGPSTSATAASAAANMAVGTVANKSRSIGNLTAGQQAVGGGAAAAAAAAAQGDQSFYQNLSVYRNQSQPNLGERSQMQPPPQNSTLPNQHLAAGANRPVSAYYPNASQQQHAASAGQHIPHQQQQQQHQSQQQQQHHHQHTMHNANPMMLSGQQTMRMNQMMAPSMPNIAQQSGAVGYTSNMSASQSMQNVNMINGGGASFGNGAAAPFGHQPNPIMGQMSAATSHPHIYHAQQQQQHLEMQQQQHLQHQQQQQHHQMHQQLHSNQSTLLRGQAAPKMGDMTDMLKRRQQRQQDMMPMHSIDGAASTAPANQSPLSPVKNLPPTAPKPQINRQQQQLHQQQQQQQQQLQQSQPQLQPAYKDDISPPLPPTATHPLYKTQPPPAATFQAAVTSTTVKGFATSANPWDREEREKEQEYRREQVRHWRDQQINDIASQPHRTAQQEEQLKQLLLERDFERRALEQEEVDEGDDGDDGDVATAATTTSISGKTGGDVAAEYPSYPLPQQQQQQQQPQQPPSGAIQPKSILKHNINRLGDDKNTPSNPSSPSKQAKSASFADDRLHGQSVAHHNDNVATTASAASSSSAALSGVARDLSNLSFGGNYDQSSGSSSALLDNGYDVAPPQPPPHHHQHHHHQMNNNNNNNGAAAAAAAPPPPPPERNSSYVIMSQKQQTLRHSVDSLTTGGFVHAHMQAQQQQQQTQSGNQNYMTAKRTSGASSNNNNHMGSHQQQQQHNGNATPQSPTMPVGSVTHLSLSQMMANRERESNKRVSFHDEDNNYVGGADGAAMHAAGEMNVIHEDSYNHMDHSATGGMPLTPTTPDGESWNTSAQPTPGVIGAQEVYRDPRARRLQEKQQQQQQQKDGEVPEKLSFKEKMKMFALESGENQTPKDKLKISRAQRDIDAVH